MKPFDLEAALAGAPVVTRDGREVTQLKLFELTGKEPLYGVIENNVYRWDFNGVFRPDGTKTSYDLFMFEAEPEVWEPTMELLWRNSHRYDPVKGTEGSKRIDVQILQQRWVSGDKSVWRDVPTFVEDI
jgi:hypothetical protein